MAYQVLVGEKMRERNYLEDLSVGGRILKLIFKKWDTKVWIGLMLFRIGAGCGLL